MFACFSETVGLLAWLARTTFNFHLNLRLMINNMLLLLLPLPSLLSMALMLLLLLPHPSLPSMASQLASSSEASTRLAEIMEVSLLHPSTFIGLWGAVQGGC